MFEFDNVQDFICKSLIGKVLVKVGDTELYEKIENAWHDPATNSIVVYSESSQTFIYNSNFIVVPAVIEIDWESLINSTKRPVQFGIYGGVLYTVEEFHDMVECGAFIPSDGFGVPSNGKYEMYVMNSTLKVLAACKYSKTVTHISWYNN